MAIGIVLFLAVPSVARSVIVGAGTPLHPATIFVLVASLWLCSTRFKEILEVAVTSLGNTIFITLLSLHSILLTFVGTGALGQLLNNLIGPLLLMGLVVLAVRDGHSRVTLVFVRVVLGSALLQAAFAVVQVFLGRPILYEAQYARFYWFDSERFSRAVGTLDSALDLALLLVVAVPFTVYIRSNTLRVLAVGVLLAGVFATQSRLGVVLALIGVVYVVFAGDTLRTRLVSALGLLVCAGGLLMSRFGQGFLDRLQNASGSTIRRTEAIDYVFDNIFSKVLIGRGLNSSYELKMSGSLGSSLENGFAMYAFDFGWVPAAGILIFLLRVFVISFAKREWGSALVMFILITMQAGYSSFMTQSASGAIMFFLAGILAARLPGLEDSGRQPSSDRISTQSPA
ncbi:hypothetical protein GD627_13365 [Arthrobacter yangruifuii]|uniref:O-antigen ligase domain-containing protein n=1 Tax=Arthrobacter yangruifuii TaxID=2606616 RepID=A0A5N6MFM5_9MICC|nr:hypothetical protein [Arthrobacter yangruifuii]KAD3515262.1 hypothetical protein GD627_13365 [Arthrobacter yangruifuii]